MSKFSRNLRDLMKKRGVNQVELSGLSGIKQQNISRYLSENPQGKFPRDLETLLSLCQALNCTLHELTGLPQLKQAGYPELSKEAVRMAEVFDRLPKDDKRRRDILKLLKE
jgi:transcriptional regulator with XRE-family HTH domain